MSIWSELSSIDCNPHIEKKGQFSYLAWTWAWAMVKERYPEAHYELLEDTIYQDGTVEVRCKVSINQGDSWLSHTMWLPVLDFKNKAIQNPNAFDINSARMRCLVKCLAMFGLGHYIYAGESTPHEPPAELDEGEARALRNLLEGDDCVAFLESYSCFDEGQRRLFVESFKPGEKTKLKKLINSQIDLAEKKFDALAASLKMYAANDDPAYKELTEDMSEFEKHKAFARLDEEVKEWYKNQAQKEG